ncbi:MAG TPA: acyl-CoA/acyl-ACP dehydrogenase [Syntrophomonadaceae bacterium]|nr:acyl-CoA/acyl-ACP dehydrogenase [Syntrophomonadaceae bacterium]
MASFTLSKEEYQLVQEVYDLAVTQISERASYLDSQDVDKPDYVIPELLAKKNLLSPIIPEKYGGRGLSMVVTANVIEKLAMGDAGAAATVVMNTYAVTPLLVAGSDELKDALLPTLCETTRPHFACTAISETNPYFDLERSQAVREDVTRIDTTAEYLEGNIIINGSKDFVLNGGVADFIVVFARSKESKRKSHLQFYVVPDNTPGVTVDAVLNKVGMRSCHTVQLGFRDVVIPEEYRIGGRSGGYLLLLQTFDRNLPLIGAVGVGIARGAYELALEAARSQMILGSGKDASQFVDFTLADMSTQIDAARLAVLRAAYSIDIDGNYSRVAIMAKLFATQVAQQVTAQAVDIIGRLGFIAGHPIDKYLRDAQMLSIVAGSDHLHRQVLSQQL